MTESIPVLKARLRDLLAERSLKRGTVKLASGKIKDLTELTEVVSAVEKADLAFSTLMQIRNDAFDAVEDPAIDQFSQSPGQRFGFNPFGGQRKRANPAEESW